MPCYVIRDGNSVGFACVRGTSKRKLQCKYCGRPADLLCDFPVDGKTCDAPICPHCSYRVASDIDYCRIHNHVALIK